MILEDIGNRICVFIHVYATLLMEECSLDII